MYASICNYVPTLQYLIEECQATVDVVNAHGTTALTFATIVGHLDTVRYLTIDKRAEVNMLDNYGFSPLTYACKNGFQSIVQVLVSQGASLEPCSMTPLYIASQYGHLDIVRFLIQQGALVDGISYSVGATAFWAAMDMGHIDIMAYLAESGADICFEYTDASMNSLTPLMYASYKGYQNVVEYLIDILDLGVRTVSVQRELTALHFAVMGGHENVIRSLLQRGADVHAPSSYGTPLEIAADKAMYHVFDKRYDEHRSLYTLPQTGKKI
jgi:ankyrin repeat protein